ncbi:MAG: ASCH domain-containing protein [Chthoniobacteraceae bacterium]
MKALSLWQPWASAIAIGAKTIETRGWFTTYRGPLAIHAAKTDTPELREFFEWHPACRPLRAAGYGRWEDLPRGAIVATCRLAECLRTTDIAGLSSQERALGNYDEGRFGWVLRDIVRLDAPITARGAQGLWEWDNGVPDLSRPTLPGLTMPAGTQRPERR